MEPIKNHNFASVSSIINFLLSISNNGEFCNHFLTVNCRYCTVVAKSQATAQFSHFVQAFLYSFAMHYFHVITDSTDSPFNLHALYTVLILLFCLSESVIASSYLAQFFMREARRSAHHFPSR